MISVPKSFASIRGCLAVALAKAGVKNGTGLTNHAAPAKIQVMNVETLREFTSNGFRPFKLHLSDGRFFNVRHPEFIAFSDLYVVVFGADRVPNLIDPDHIVSAKPLRAKPRK